MESAIQSSFIPQDARHPTQTTRRDDNSLSDIFLLLSVVLLIVSGATAVGVYLYEQYLKQDNERMSKSLVSEKAAFEPAYIQTIGRMADRIRSAEALLSAHRAHTKIFEALSKTTLETVSFSNMNLDASDPVYIKITMSGVARSVNSIALQATKFSTAGIISNPIFSGINKQQDGVHFNFSANVKQDSIRYITQNKASEDNSSAQSAKRNIFTTPPSDAEPNKASQ